MTPNGDGYVPSLPAVITSEWDEEVGGWLSIASVGSAERTGRGASRQESMINALEELARIVPALKHRTPY